MEQWERVRRAVYIEGKSKRSVMREEGLHQDTLYKMLKHSSPLGYKRREGKVSRKIDAFLPWIKLTLEQDKDKPKKHRHTVRRLFDRLVEERGFTGSYTIVREAVQAIRKRSAEVHVPLQHRPGEAQVDFGHVLVNLKGQLRMLPFFVMSLPYSDAFFVQVFERECTETFQEAHARAFEYFGGVPKRISYDNSRIAVSKIMGAHERELTNGFLQLRSHYLYESHFCGVRRGNEKGVVEGIVKYARSNFMIPVPQVRHLHELNEHLVGCCQRDLKRQLRGQNAPKEVLLKEDKQAMNALPESRFEACKTIATRGSSLSLVRFDCNDYSIPVRYAHHEVTAKGYADTVKIFHEASCIAEHERIWDKEQFAFDPVHYLALLERKPGAFDHARALEGWELPDCFDTIRRRLENTQGKSGVREFIRVLRLLEKHPLYAVEAAVKRSLEKGGCTRDAIAQYLYPDYGYNMAVFCLDGHPHLKGVQVDAPQITHYNTLLKHEEVAL